MSELTSLVNILRITTDPNSVAFRVSDLQRRLIEKSMFDEAYEVAKKMAVLSEYVAREFPTLGLRFALAILTDVDTIYQKRRKYEEGFYNKHFKPFEELLD